jgi:hypothetical protein
MKTLADFKRALLPGSRWLSKHVKQAEFQEREVLSCSKEFVRFTDGSRLDFPAATEFEITADGEAQVYWPEGKYDPRKLVLTYKKV